MDSPCEFVRMREGKIFLYGSTWNRQEVPSSNLLKNSIGGLYAKYFGKLFSMWPSKLMEVGMIN